MIGGENKGANRRVIKTLFFLVAAMIILILLTIYLAKHQPFPPYIGVYKNQDQSNGYFRLVPISRPVISRQSLLARASLAAVSAYTYTGANIDQTLQTVAKTYFTPDGGKSFLKAMDDSGAISEAKDRALVVTAVSQGAPVILQQGILLGTLSFRVQLPILVTYQSASDKRRETMIVTMMVVTVPTWELPQGIGISQFSAVKT